MATEELKPRSNVLREALERGKHDDKPLASMLSVAEACKCLGISKWSLYKLIRSGELSSVKIGSRRLIAVRAIHKLIDKLEKNGRRKLKHGKRTKQ